MPKLERRFLARPAPQPTNDYGRVIKLMSLAFGVVGFLVSVCCLLLFIAKSSFTASIISIIAGILFTTAVFWALGLGITCLFAPTDFLKSPSGQVWLAKIGVKSVVAARIACILYVLFVVGIILIAAFFIVANY